MHPRQIAAWSPLVARLRDYERDDFMADAIAGAVIAVLLIPQGMAYALIAGLPVQYGLYASLLPPVCYALLGTSRSLSVGPVSILALLVVQGLTSAGFQPGDGEYVQAAATLSLLSAGLLVVMGALRLGTLAHYLSHSVLSGFISAVAVLIIFSQLASLLGLPKPSGDDLPHQVLGLAGSLDRLAPMASAVGMGALVFLSAGRPRVKRMLDVAGMPTWAVSLALRAFPLLAIAVGVVVALLIPTDVRLPVVGEVPGGLPDLATDWLPPDRWPALLPTTIVIVAVGYVESISVARVLAYRRRERVDPNRELLALGAANVGASLLTTMPVAGGLGRSMVNEDAGARTQVAALIAAVLVALSVALLAPLFEWIPLPILAAIVIVSVSGLLDWKGLRDTWRYDRAEAAVVVFTGVTVLLFGMGTGLILGVVASLALPLWRSGHPHIAVVGRIEGTEHFRNVDRHAVQTWQELLLIRPDESLFFANAAFLDDYLSRALSQRPDVRHTVLICSAVNRIDPSALETLRSLTAKLESAGVRLHLAEVKGPVMDRLGRTAPERWLNGRVFLTTEEAVETLTDRKSSGFATTTGQRDAPEHRSG